MKLVKSFLLGSAAAFFAVSGASAADLGVKKPSAVEYVKTCPAYGAGFFMVPGTTSCLKLVGRVRADYAFNNPLMRTSDSNTFRARAYLGFDHRTATEYGVLRTYVRAFFNRDNANAYSSVLEYGFIQFGGLTVGRVTPVYELGYYSTTGAISGYGGLSDISYVNSIGYTANFGGGFSATIALDSAKERSQGINGQAFIYGQSMPDVVAALAYNAAWGQVKASGAVHQVRSFNGANDSKYGFAGQIGAKFNLDMLSKGSNVWAGISAARGAASYTGHAGASIGAKTLFFYDGTTDSAGKIKLSASLAAAMGVQYYVTPTVYLGLGGQYSTYKESGFRKNIKTYDIVGNVGWQPAAGFLILGEAVVRGFKANANDVGNTVGKKNDVLGRIRFQRDF